MHTYIHSCIPNNAPPSIFIHTHIYAYIYACIPSHLPEPITDALFHSPTHLYVYMCVYMYVCMCACMCASHPVIKRRTHEAVHQDSIHDHVHLSRDQHYQHNMSQDQNMVTYVTSESRGQHYQDRITYVCRRDQEGLVLADFHCGAQPALD
jgi:hypothetical protein